MRSASYMFFVLMPNFSSVLDICSSLPFHLFALHNISTDTTWQQHHQQRRVFQMDPQTEGWTGLDPLPVSLTADQKEKMGQASVSLSLITQQCLNKATSARSAPLLLLVKLLHLFPFNSSSRPHLFPPFPTGDRTVSEARWASYPAVSSLEMRFSSC